MRNRNEDNVRIEELAKISPRLTELFGMPVPRVYNYNQTYYVWDVLNQDLVIEHIIEAEGEFFSFNIWLQADYEYTAQWPIAKCPVDCNLDNFIKHVECIRDNIIEANRIFPTKEG